MELSDWQKRVVSFIAWPFLAPVLVVFMVLMFLVLWPALLFINLKRNENGELRTEAPNDSE